MSFKLFISAIAITLGLSFFLCTQPAYAKICYDEYQNIIPCKKNTQVPIPPTQTSTPTQTLTPTSTQTSTPTATQTPTFIPTKSLSPTLNETPNQTTDSNPKKNKGATSGLISIIIISAIVVLLIALIRVIQLLRARLSANEASSAGALKTISSAQTDYDSVPKSYTKLGTPSDVKPEGQDDSITENVSKPKPKEDD